MRVLLVVYCCSCDGETSPVVCVDYNTEVLSAGLGYALTHFIRRQQPHVSLPDRVKIWLTSVDLFFPKFCPNLVIRAATWRI